MALAEFYWAQVRFCEDAARISTDPEIIKSLRDEAARYRSLANTVENDANENDPYISSTEEGKRAADGDAPDQKERRGEARPKRSEG